MERYRDPVHGFIEVRPLEKKIIDSAPFQRLRHIKQLAMTNLVFHGAEQIPVQSSIEDEKSVVLLNKRMGKRVSISDESHIIRALANKIGIRRLYARPDIAGQARTIVRN